MKRKVSVITAAIVAVVCFVIGNKGKDIPPCNNQYVSNTVYLDDSISPPELRTDFKFYRKTLTSLHPGLYKWQSKAAITSLLDSVAGLLNTAITRSRFYTYLNIINNRIGCSHTDVYFNNKQVPESGVFPIPIAAIDNKYYSVCSECTVPRGARLITINGNTMEAIAERLKIYESVDGGDRFVSLQTIALNFQLKYFLAFGKQKEFVVRYEDPLTKKIKKVTLDTEFLGFTRVAKWHPFWFNDFDYDVELNDSTHTAVLKLRTFSMGNLSKQQAYEHFLENTFRLLAMSGTYHNLVIDLRNNPGGENPSCFLLYSYLAKKPFYEDSSSSMNNVSVPSEYVTGGFDNEFFDSVKRTEYHRSPSDTSILLFSSKTAKKWDRAKYAYNDNVFVITNSRTASASVRLAAMLQVNDAVKIIGEEPNGNYCGSTSYFIKEFTLPNSGITFSVPLVNVHYNLQAHPYPPAAGLRPDYNVPLTVDDLLSGKDTQLEFIYKKLVKN